MSLFPSSPTSGQQTNVNGNLYSYDSTKGWLKTTSSSGSSTINDNITSSTTETYSIDKIISLLSNKQNKLYLQSTQPTSPSTNDIWINNTSSPYVMSIYNGTSFIQIGSSSGGTGITDWIASTSYTANISIVIYNNLLYRCNTTHTSGTTFSANSSYWTFIGESNATSINGIAIDDTTRSNGKVLTYNGTTGKNEWATVNISGVVGSSQLTTIFDTTIASGSEVTFNHPESTNIIPVIEEQIAGSSVTDTHVDFSDSSKYVLQDSGKILFNSNKAQLDIYTKLLMHMDDSTFKDECGNTVTNTAVTLDTTNYKIGSSSAYFNESSNIKITPINNLNVGTGDFTISFWEKGDSAQTGASPMIFRNNYNASWNTNCISIHHYHYHASALNKLSVWIYNNSSSSPTLTSTTLTNNTNWRHVAITRQSGVLRLFINGILESSATYSGAMDFGLNGFLLGYQSIDSKTSFKGNIDEFCIINGIALYTGNFTPTTSSQTVTPYIIVNTPLYLITTGTSDYSLTTIDTITSLTIPVTATANSTVKCLFSVDNKQNWLYYNGTSVQKFTGDITQDWGTTNSSYIQLQTYFTNKSIESLTSDLGSLGIVPINLDIAFQLNSLSTSETPTIGAITMVYTTLPHNEFGSIGTFADSYSTYGIKRLSDTQLSVKNKSSVSKTVKLSVVTSA